MISRLATSSLAPRALNPRFRLSLQYAVHPRGAPSRAQFRKWAKAALRQEAKIVLRIVGEAEARALNRDYCGKNYATNVLTFCYDDTTPLSGDIVLCAPVVAREAREQNKGAEAHYAHLTVHGVLHLQGYDHENGAEAAVMESLESQIVTRLGYPDPYIRD